jgi:hypothetical protein
MAWLTITAGSTGSGSYSGDFQSDDAQEPEPFMVGEWVRAFNGTARSTERGLARSWKISTPPIDAAEYATLKGIIALGTCTMSGTITDDETIDVLIKRTGTKLLKDSLYDDDTGFIVSLEIQEVTPDEFR